MQQKDALLFPVLNYENNNVTSKSNITIKQLIILCDLIDKYYIYLRRDSYYLFIYIHVIIQIIIKFILSILYHLNHMIPAILKTPETFFKKFIWN